MVAPVSFSPRNVAQDDSVDVFSIGEGVDILVKPVTELRMNAQGRKEIRADVGEIDFSRTTVAFEKVTAAGGSVVRDLVECLVLLLPRSQVEIGCAAIEV